MSRMNEETLITSAIAALKSNINTKITAINTEKDDGLELNQIDSNAYCFVDFPGDAPAYDPCVVYRIAITSENSPMGSSSTRIAIGFELIFSDEMEADSDNSLKRAMRYRRALKEVIRENVAFQYLAAITDVPDVPWSSREQHFYSIGIGLEMVIAN